MKKSFSKFILLALAALTLIFVTACDDGKAKDSGEDGASERPTTVTIGTASQGGTYFIYGGGLASLLEKEFDITSNVEVTGGPVHNMQLIDAKDIDIAMITLGPGYEGYTGTGDWTDGKKLEDVRVIFPMYTTPFHWWALEKSGVTSLADIKGERVGVGPAGGTSGTYLPLIHEALGLDTNNVQAGASDMTSQQMDGQLDIIGFAAGIPISAVSEVETQERLTSLELKGLSEI